MEQDVEDNWSSLENELFYGQVHSQTQLSSWQDTPWMNSYII